MTMTMTMTTMRRSAAPLLRSFATAAASSPSSAAPGVPLSLDSVAASEIKTWSPKFAIPKNYGSFARLSDDFMKLVPGISPNINSQFKLVSFPALMYRESTAQIIDVIKDEAEKDKCSSAIFLDGARGIGKSSAMMQTASFCKSQGWIVMYFPRLSQWISGIEPYEKSTDADMYYQNPLAAKLLDQILKWNEPALEKIPISGDGSSRSVADVARAGAADSERAHAAFEQVFHAILSAKDRPPVLLALDQAGALFRTTAYCDADSRPLSSNKFALPALMYRTISELGHPNMAILAAGDRTEFQTFSPFLERTLKTTTPINTNHGLLSTDLYIDTEANKLASRNEHGVVLPHAMDPTHNDLFCSTNPVPLTNVTRFIVPALSLSELAGTLMFYRQNNVLYRDVTEKLVKKRWMVSQGNPLELFKSCIVI